MEDSGKSDKMIEISRKVVKPTLTTNSTMIFRSLSKKNFFRINIYMCVCVCVRERERAKVISQTEIFICNYELFLLFSASFNRRSSSRKKSLLGINFS